MPSLSVHLLIGLCLFLLCYFTTRDPVAGFLSLICAILPDADALFGVHRCFIVHNFLVPIILLLLSIILRSLGRYRSSRIMFWAGIGYLSHILFDMFTWYVAVLYPISNLCIWIKSIVRYSGMLRVGLQFSISTVSCSSLPVGVPSMSDKILIPVAVFVFLILVVSTIYGARRRSHNSTS